MEVVRVYIPLQRCGYHRHLCRLNVGGLTRFQLDYSAGVMPITCVDRKLDVLSPVFRPRSKIEADAYRCYDADDMHGLPVGMQIVGRRLEEEKVLEGMKLIESLLKSRGIAYEHMSI